MKNRHILLPYIAFILAYGTSHANKQSFPEAYAGLNDSAYHLINIDQSKSNQLSFELENTHINIALPQRSKASSQTSDISFSQNLKDGFITATKGKNSLFGQVHLNNKHYILTTNTSGIWAVELPKESLQFNDCGFDHSAQQINHLENQKALSNNKAAGTLIDVLMIHDQAIKNRYPGDLLNTRIAQYIHVANQTYANSNIDLALRLVGVDQVDYNFNNANQVARDLIQKNLARTSLTSGLSHLSQLRDETGADLVIFLRTMDIETRGNCGIAFFPVQTGNNNFNASYGVNVMSDGMSSWSICTDQLMVHEIGHNLGAGHHNTTTQQRWLPDAAGFAKLNQFGTVMGSFGTGDPNRFLELDYFSNPAVRCGGGPCGISGQANNANVINQLKGVVANYKTSSSTAPLPANFSLLLTDLDNDGTTDNDDAFPYNATETSDRDGDGKGDNVDAFPDLASEYQDFDQDGIGDIADPDDDNDGVSDLNDEFPYDATESMDSDQDGVGDVADDFVFEANETIDSDNDGIGNFTDADDDADGTVDISSDKQDLLVISVGNNRILRFDAQTGQAKGIEVLPDDGLLTFQSDMTVDNKINQLFYSTASSIKTLDLMDQQASPQIMIPAYAENGQVQLNTGFPTALSTNNARGLLTAKLDATHLDIYFYNNFNRPEQGYFAPAEVEDEENIIDIKIHQNQIFALGQNTRIYTSNINGTILSRVGDASLPWLHDPYAFVVTDDKLLLHTDQSRNSVMVTNGETGSYEGIFADLAQLGYSNPTGIELTADGRVLVAASDQNAILEFNLASGAFLGELVKDFGLSQPHKVLLVPQLEDRFHQDANKVIRPNAGNWFNPSSSGRGFNIGIFDNRLQVLWFTFDNSGMPVWYTSADFLLGHEFDTELLKTKQLPDGSVSAETIGHINITFDNEREAVMSWQMGDDTGQESIQWLQFSTEPENQDHTGMWSRSDTPGWGTAVITNGDKTFAIPFIYDSDGEPRWLISNVSEQSTAFNLDMIAVFSDTLCPTCSGTPSFTTSPAGTIQLNLDNNPFWESNMVLPSPLNGSWTLESTPMTRISSEPTKPR
jgi:hypothetical protein